MDDLAYKTALIKLNMSNSNKLNYTVIPPRESFKNKSYTEWVQDWSSWFHQTNPDRNNNGDVVFLRSMPLVEGNYGSEANVMVGNESLEISADQRLLVPIITSNYVADGAETSEWLYGMVRSQILAGDCPPLKEQLRIDGEPIDDGNAKENDLKTYEVETPVFLISIPDSSAGKSLKDQMEAPFQSPGFFPSVTRGYFVMLELQPNEEYYIECYATGATTALGPYYASFLYHVIVNEPSQKGRVNIPPSRLNKNILARLHDKKEKGELEPATFAEITKTLTKSSKKIETAVNKNKNR